MSEELGCVPNGTGLSSNDQAASRPDPTGVDPSHIGAIHAVAEAWASIDGKLEAYLRERDENIDYEDPTYTGHYDGYLIEAESMIRRVWRRGYTVVPRLDAQGIEARQGRGEDSACESPVGSADAPDPKREGETQQKETAA